MLTVLSFTNAQSFKVSVPTMNDTNSENDSTINVTLRPAREEDQALIKQMVVREAELDPTSLHWSHFILAELADESVPQGERVIGLGQIRPYRNCPELGSLYVRKPYRRHGVASQIMWALLASRPAPIYLECLSYNVPYYQRFGFYQIPWYRAPWPLSLKSGVGTFISKLGLMGNIRVAAMRWDGYRAQDQS
jgi:amino-acid N-acetyltransferase